MRVLIVTIDGGGNLPPELGLARELRRRGDDVLFLGHEAQRAAIEASGFEFERYRRGRDYDASAPRGTIRGVLELAALFADRRMGTDAVELAARERIDALVVDCLLWGAAEETVAAGLPVASLVHSMWGYFQDLSHGPLGAIGRLRGVDPVAAFRAPARSLVATRSDFESLEAFPADVVHLGFVWQGAPVEAHPDPERPRVLVSFSTTSFPGQARALQTTLDALEGMPVEVVATTGAVDPAELRAPANARVVQRADHGELLPSTALVIGHGGLATTARALSHGIPLLVMPMHPLMDQPAVGRAIEDRAGAGRLVSKKASAAAIRGAVTALLQDEGARVAAGRLGREARDHDGAARGADALAFAR